MKTLLLTLLAVAAPAAVAQKPGADKSAARAVAPSTGVVGEWHYVVRPDDPVAEGTFTIEQHGGGLDGTFMTDAPRKLDALTLDGAELTMAFTQPGMGVITIRTTVDGDAMTGEAQPEGQDALPFIATRGTAGADADDQ